ncbi:MAG: hypothetical protein K0R30_669 [Ornithinibacter sp.]|nr:hypothetical protein [Ornithinibacter sp.]
MTTTSSAWVSRCSAWTPEPVPTSRARSTWGLGVHEASVVDAPPTPSTCSGRSGEPVASSPRSEATHQSTSSAAYGRTSHSATTASPSGATRPSATAPSTPRVGSAAAASRTSTGSPRVKSRTSVAQGSSETAVTRWAGRACSRSSAAEAIGPSSSVTPATVNRDRARSARRAGRRSGSTRGVEALIEDERMPSAHAAGMPRGRVPAEPGPTTFAPSQTWAGCGSCATAASGSWSPPMPMSLLLE